MSLKIRLEPVADGNVPDVSYRWDPDTEILCAALHNGVLREGLTGSLDIEGENGAWLTFELLDGRLAAVEVAVWPDVESVASLSPPAPAGAATVLVPSAGHGRLDALEVDTSIRAVADAPERTIHFRIGDTRPSTAHRVARDFLLEVDARQRIAGLWFLNVPPFPQ